MRIPRTAGLMFGLLVTVTIPLSAQIVRVDEGTFDVLLQGRAVGSEEFSIVRRGDGPDAQTLATAQIRIDGDQNTRMAPLLRAEGLAHSLTRYELKADGHDVREVHLERSGERRLHTTVLSDEGEREQELRYQPDVVVLEDGVAHHYHFLGVRIASGSRTVPILVPAGREQLSAEISDGVGDGVEIAGTSVSATRFTVTLGDRTRVVWYDDQMRVLKVEDPTRETVAVRRDLP